MRERGPRLLASLFFVTLVLHLANPQIWQIMKDYVMDCPTIPSALFVGPVSEGYVGALNATFIANPGNTVQVSQFWKGVQVLAANAAAANVQGATDATKAVLVANNNAVAAQIAPLSSSPGNFSQPAQYANAIAAYPMYQNASTVGEQLALDPTLFPPGYFCPVGQGKVGFGERR